MADNDKADEFAGKGGSYLIDADGKRVLIHRTETEPKHEPAAADDSEGAE